MYMWGEYIQLQIEIIVIIINPNSESISHPENLDKETFLIKNF